MAKPLVSIVIPTYNREDTIEEALESALSQTEKNIEIIVPDNASTDETTEIVESHARQDRRIKLIKNEVNSGPVINWKRGIDAACGKYIKILWSDDLISNDFLAKTLALYDKKPELAFVFSKTEIGASPDSPDRKVYYDAMKATGIYPAESFINGILCGLSLPYSPGCAIFRADTLRKAFVSTNDLFENRYLMNGAGPDLLMYLCSTNHAGSFGYVHEPLSFFRAHKSSITLNSEWPQLHIDYDKSIIWFLHHFVNSRAAMHYWIHSFKKNKLYTKRHRAHLKGMSTPQYNIKRACSQHMPFLLKCWLLKSRRYLDNLLSS